MKDCSDLKGKTIVKIEKEPEGQWIDFYLGDGEKWRFLAEGDCCSNSWVQEIMYPENIIGEVVVNVIEHTTASNIDDGEYGYLDIYNLDLVSKKGTCTVDFRNSSNGYYGGSLVFNRGNSMLKNPGYFEDVLTGEKFSNYDEAMRVKE